MSGYPTSEEDVRVSPESSRTGRPTVTMAFLGDVMLGRDVAARIGERELAGFWGDLRPILVGSDLVVANLECAITGHESPWSRTPKRFHFRAPSAAVDVLIAGGVRAVSVANNHVLDYEEEGLRETLANLDAAGIVHAGAGEELARAREPAIVDAGDLRVAIVAFTDNEPGWAAAKDRPGVAYLRFLPTPGPLDAVRRAVRRARDDGARFVVLSLHWGPNWAERPPRRFRRFARAAIALGVDLVHGHSAHRFQGVEIHRGRPILYDTGEALDDYEVDPEMRNDRSFVFLVDVEGRRVRALTLVPILLRSGEVGLGRDRDFEETCERMQVLSAELGTRFERNRDGLVVRLPGRNR